MTPKEYGVVKIADLTEEAIHRGFEFRGARLPANLAARIEFKALSDAPGIIPYQYPIVTVDGGQVTLESASDVAALWAALTTHVVTCRSIAARYYGLIAGSDDSQEAVDAILIAAIAWARG